jgi:hypothetical protein
MEYSKIFNCAPATARVLQGIGRRSQPVVVRVVIGGIS